MRPFLTPIVFIVISCNAIAASADTAWIKDDPTPKFGRVVRQDHKAIMFQVIGTSQPVEIERTSIIALVISFDTQRLKRLNLDNVAAYRDFAEELSIQARDPIAVELAERLYVIGIAHGSDELRKSCLLGLQRISQNELQIAQIKKLLAMHAGASAVEVEQKPEAVAQPTARQRLQALQVARSIRQGKSNEVSQLLIQPAVQEALDFWKSIVSVSELKQMTGLNRLDARQLEKVLELELAVDSQNFLPGAGSSPSRELDWDQLAHEIMDTPDILPTYADLSKFDPDECLFRNGEWVRDSN